MKRYTVTMVEDKVFIEPVDLEGHCQLLTEILEIMPEYSVEQVNAVLVNYAYLAQLNLSHPSDSKQLQDAFNFMVVLTNRLALRPDGKQLWHTWNLGAKGQLERDP